MSSRFPPVPAVALAGLLLAPASQGAHAGGANDPVPAPARASTVATIADAYMAALAAAFPETGTASDLPATDHGALSENTPAGITGWQAYEDRVLAQLRAVRVDPAGPESDRVPVVPDPETGSVLKKRLELLDKATDLTDRFVAVRAAGYVDGIADGAVGLGYACYPAGVARAEIREVVMKYLRDHPERLDDPASLLVLNAVFEAYPCKRQDPQ